MSIKQKIYTFILKYVDERNNNSIAFWKQVIFYSASILILSFSLIALIHNVITTIIQGQWPTVWVNISVFILMLLLVFNKKIPFFIKAHISCLLIFTLGIFLMIIYGPVGDTRLWFLLFIFLSSIFTSIKSSSIAAILVLLGDSLFGILNHLRILNWKDYIYDDLAQWHLVSLNVFIISIIIVATINILLHSVDDSLKRVENSHLATIMGLAKLAEYRDTDTGAHLERISCYSVILATAIQKLPKYKDYITPQYLEDLSVSSILHDIGKVGIPDKILLKPGKLTDEEFEIIKKHPEYGEKVLAEICEKVEDQPVLNIARYIALYHHEKWNGSGYPTKKKGEDIPLSARIVSIVDVYDALTTDRVYKKAFPHEKAVAIINQGKGTQFDPELIDCFNKITYKFKFLSKG